MATPSSATRLSVGILGGSISGCTAAIALSRSGLRVTIFERSTGMLTGRGAGIRTNHLADPPDRISGPLSKD